MSRVDPDGCSLLNHAETCRREPPLPRVVRNVAESLKRVSRNALEGRSIILRKITGPGPCLPLAKYAWYRDVLAVSTGRDLRVERVHRETELFQNRSKFRARIPPKTLVADRQWVQSRAALDTGPSVLLPEPGRLLDGIRSPFPPGAGISSDVDQ